MRKVAFILNPISGRGRKKEILGYIEVMLKKYPGWEGNFYTTQGVGDASSAARKFAEEGYDVVVAIGGDGTVNEVAKGVVGTSCRLAIRLFVIFAYIFCRQFHAHFTALD